MKRESSLEIRISYPAESDLWEQELQPPPPQWSFVNYGKWATLSSNPYFSNPCIFHIQTTATYRSLTNKLYLKQWKPIVFRILPLIWCFSCSFRRQFWPKLWKKGRQNHSQNRYLALWGWNACPAIYQWNLNKDSVIDYIDISYLNSVYISF